MGPKLSPLLLLSLLSCADPGAALNQAPQARAGLDLRVVRKGSMVYIQLDGTESSDPEGDKLEFRWRLLRAPDSLFLGSQDRKSPQPVVGLSGVGLYLFELKVRDPWQESAPDQLNVWVEDGLKLPDSGSPDVGVEEDLGVESEAGIEAGFPDQGPPAEPPEPVLEMEARRIPLGSSVGLSAARSRAREGAHFHWETLSAPFGESPYFEAEGIAARFEPRSPGRYLIQLSVSDDQGSASVAEALYVMGREAWLLAPQEGRLLGISLDTGLESGRALELPGALEGILGLSLWEGVIYLTAQSTGGASELILISSGGEERYALPGQLAQSPPLLNSRGLWLATAGVPLLIQLSPGAEEFNSYPLPADYLGINSLRGDEERAYLSQISPRSALLSFNFEQGSPELEYSLEGCGPAEVQSHQGALWGLCRDRTALFRLLPGAQEGLQGQQLIGLPEEGLLLKLALQGGSAALTQEGTENLFFISEERFELPLDDPARLREAQLQTQGPGVLQDLGAAHGRFYGLFRLSDGAQQLWAFSLEGELLWRSPEIPSGFKHLLIDGADL